MKRKEKRVRSIVQYLQNQFLLLIQNVLDTTTIINIITNVAKCKLGKVIPEPKHPAGLYAVGWPQGLTFLTICLHVSSTHHTTLNRSLLWSPYLQFACSVELCGSLLWSPILPILHPALPTPRRKWFMVGIRSGKFLVQVREVWGQVSGQSGKSQVREVSGAGWCLLAGLVPAHKVAMTPPCYTWYFHGNTTNLPWHRLSSSSNGNEFNNNY